MTIENLMNNNPLRLQDGDTISNAARLLLEKRLSGLPVVDAAGRYLGMFTYHRLLALLLPKAVLIEGGVSDLAFMSDPMEILCERMREHGAQMVGEYLEKDVLVLHPETALLESVLLLYRGENDIPVVDKTSGRLVGMLSCAELLARVCKEK